MLMRMSPGAKLPDHEHVMIEQTYVLEGSLVCHEGTARVVCNVRWTRSSLPARFGAGVLA